MDFADLENDGSKGTEYAEDFNDEEIIFDRDIELKDGKDIKVITDDRALPTSSEVHEKYCLFGTSSHIDALEKKKEEFEKMINSSSEKLNSVKKQLDLLKKYHHDSSRSMTNLNELAENSEQSHDMAIDKAERDENEVIHATSETFGRLTNFKIIKDDFEEHLLIQKPIIRQYFIGSILYRSKHERKVATDELFFDLIFVAIISSLSELLHDISWLKFHNFIVLFYPVWLTWNTATNYVNRFGHADILFKLFLLLNMLATSGMGISAFNVFPEKAEVQSTINVFFGSFLFCRVVFVVAITLYAFRFHKFTKVILVTASPAFISLIPLILLLVFQSSASKLVCFWIFFGIEIAGLNVTVSIVRFLVHAKYRIALNIEHFTERLGCFTIIVLGEVVGVLYHYNADLHSINDIYIGVVLGLLIGIAFQWIYFDVDASRQYLHAIRRNVHTGLAWSWLHFPLHCFMITGAGGLSQIIKILGDGHGMTMQMSYALRFLTMGSFGMSLFLISIIGILHKSLDDKHGFQPNLSKKFRISSRILVSLILFILPLVLSTDAISPLFCIMIIAILIMYQAAMEEYGKLKSDVFKK